MKIKEGDIIYYEMGSDDRYCVVAFVEKLIPGSIRYWGYWEDTKEKAVKVYNEAGKPHRKEPMMTYLYSDYNNLKKVNMKINWRDRLK
jgi:hypothetical protein